MLRKILGAPAVATVLAAALVALAGCGQQPVKMGAAAIVADERITTAQVQDAVQAFQEAHARTSIPPTQLVLPDPQSLPRSELMLLLRFQVTRQAADREGITVTDAEVEEFIAAQGGRQALEQRALIGGIPPSLLSDGVREVLLRQRLAERLAPGAGQRQADLQVQRYLGEVARDVGVTVNPRYGQFDHESLMIQPAADTLSRPDDPPDASPDAS